ncbi:tonsoku-like protein [Bombina bombina]|uniref:tonsoku-like protein n=1 Tax=Bombina bombina TaxID=8345 RepID=UPI00235A6ABA|nr:tonsoku-like protein [Bombina bombina]
MSDREIRQLEKAKCRAEKSGNLKEEAAVCNQLGEILARTGRFQEAIEEHRQELRICESLGDVIGCAVANRKIGESFAELGNYEAALKHQRLHLDLARSVSSDIEEQRALATIGRTYLYMCDAGRAAEAQGPAEDAFLKSLAVVDEKLDGKVSAREISEMRARLFLNLGFLYDSMKETAKCNVYIRKSVYIAEQNQLHEDLYRANSTLGSIHLRNGEHSKAIRCWEAARECARRMRDKHMESDCYSSIGQVLLSLGDLAAGKRSLKKAYLLGSQHPSDRDAVRRSLKYGIKGCHLEEALSELPEDDQQGALSLYEQLGDLYCKVGCYSKAVEYYKMQLRCAESLGKSERELAVIHISLAATFTDLKDHRQAVTHYRAELELRKGNPKEKCKTWMNMGLSYEEDGQDYSEIQRCLSSALQCAKQAGEVGLQRRVLQQLLSVQRKWRDSEAEDTEAQLGKILEVSSGESSDEEMENSEPLQESELELSQSDDEEDLEGYDKSVPGRRRVNRWNRRNEKGETVLHRACIDGNLKMVQCLLDKGHPLNPRDYCGWTPLHEACNHGHLEIVEILLDRGANINDPGGPLCDGITPLHDSLSSGNFHVAQLLIRRGASVTQKSSKGIMPLGSLQEWTQTYGSHLDQETRRIRKETETLLREALAGKIVPAPQPPRPAQDLQDSELFDAEDSQPLSTALPSISRAERENQVPRRESRATERRAPLPRVHELSLITEDNDFALHVVSPIHTSTQLSREDSFYNESSEQLMTPMRPVIKKQRFGVQRSSSDSSIPVETTEKNESVDLTLQSLHKTRLSDGGVEAYQSAIKGLGSAKTRIFTQSLTKSPNTVPDPVRKLALVPSDQYLDDDWLEDDLKELSRSRKRGRRSPTDIDTGDDDESSDKEDEVPEETSQGRDKHVPRTLSLSRKRSRQTKLTQIVDRAVVGRTKSSVHNNSSIPRLSEVSVSRAQNVSADTVGRTESPGIVINPSLPAPIRVRVRVQDNVFLIPIPHSDRDALEISWLADQASQRYYQSCGLLPRLNLKKDGALLAPRDVILHVLQSNEEVLAEVHSWDLPPITDRYKKACQSLAVEENRLVLKALERQELSPSLSLCRLSLRSRDLCPLLRALKLQTTLRELHLCGNVLGDSEAGELLGTLSTMPNLTHLNLSCNRLTHEGVRRLSPPTSAPENQAFKSLEELDLSMNPLGDSLAQPLAFLLHCCPVLHSLHLHGCQLSAKFLQQYRLLLADAFRGAVHLKNISLSNNPLSSTGVELVLKTVSHEVVSQLELRAVTAGNREGLLMEPLMRYLTQDGCALTHLNLSCNHLTDEAVQCLARCLPVSLSLKFLDLSGNPGVGTDGLECLLKAVQERSSEMSNLNLTGCSIRGPLSSSFLDAISSSLQELRLGSCFLTKRDREALSQAWLGDKLLLFHQHKLFFKKL